MSVNLNQAIVTQNRVAYDRLAEVYARQWADRPDLQLADQFLSLFHGSRILDIGCGPGQYSSYFIDQGYTVEAIDTSSAMLQLARNRDVRIPLRKLDMSQLDYPNFSFDGLWVCASLPHIHRTSVPRVLRKFQRILKPDGCLLVNAIIGYLEHRIEAAEELELENSQPGRFFQWYPSTVFFREILEQAGFEVLLEQQRTITSKVLEKAIYPTNLWCNYFCRPGD